MAAKRKSRKQPPYNHQAFAQTLRNSLIQAGAIPGLGDIQWVAVGALRNGNWYLVPGFFRKDDKRRSMLWVDHDIQAYPNRDFLNAELVRLVLSGHVKEMQWSENPPERSNKDIKKLSREEVRAEGEYHGITAAIVRWHRETAEAL